MRGNAEAVASAYSLDDYRIADDLGGEAAYADLRDRALGARHPPGERHGPQPHGHRFALGHRPSGVVPVAARAALPGVHVHGAGPVDRRARRDRPRGPLLGRQRRRGRVQALRPCDRRRPLRLPRQRRHELSVERHGPAQLPELRRFASRSSGRSSTSRGGSRSSGSMPRWSSPRSTSSGCGGREPGAGGGIPSRAEHAIPKREFDARMPVEFWREVVDRVAAEVPGTLLLAEAFWLLEGYFVRTLGMHRVYNSAFMHMLRDEDGAGYRKVIRETIEFDPEILKRYVNFMSNPDEKTALEQFGKGDKYFGVATVLATLPGLPMLGPRPGPGLRREVRHGVPAGDARRAARPLARRAPRARDLPAAPSPGVVRRGARLPALRLRDRRRGVDEHVLAYSNGRGPTRSLVVYHDRFASTAGLDPRIGAVRAQGGRRHQAAGAALAGRGPRPAERAGAFVTFRDARTGLEYLRSCREIWEHGLRLSLDAYAGPRLLGVPRGRDGSGRASGAAWPRGSAGAGVPSLDDALRELQLEPVHAAVPSDLRRRPRRGRPRWTAPRPTSSTSSSGGSRPFLAAVGRGDRRERRPGRRRRPRSADETAAASADGALDAAPRGPGGAPRLAGPGPTGRARARRRRRRDEPRPGTTSCGLPGLAGRAARGRARRGAAGPWPTSSGSCCRCPGRPCPGHAAARPMRGSSSSGWRATSSATAIGLNTWQGVEYLDRDAFADCCGWAVRLDAIERRGHGESADAAGGAGERLARRRRAADRPAIAWTGACLACASSPAGQRCR